MFRIGYFILVLGLSSTALAAAAEPVYMFTSVFSVRCEPDANGDLGCSLNVTDNEIKLELLPDATDPDKLVGLWTDSYLVDKYDFSFRIEADKKISKNAYHMHVFIDEKTLPESLMFGTRFGNLAWQPVISMNTPTMAVGTDGFLVLGLTVTKSGSSVQMPKAARVQLLRKQIQEQLPDAVKKQKIHWQ